MGLQQDFSIGLLTEVLKHREIIEKPGMRFTLLRADGFRYSDSSKKTKNNNRKQIQVLGLEMNSRHVYQKRSLLKDPVLL